MNADLIQQDSLSTDAIWRQPNEEFFIPDDTLHADAVESARDRINDATAGQASGEDAAILITDDDADGLGAGVVLSYAYDTLAVIPAGPHGVLDLRDALAVVSDMDAEHLDVWIADIGPDASDRDNVVSNITGSGGPETLFWFDHHDWDDTVYGAVDEWVETLDVDDGSGVPKEEERCAAELVCNYVCNKLGVDIPAHVREAIEVTGIYDCWKKTEDDAFLDERAPDLADYATLVDTPQEYMDAVAEHGANIAEDSTIRAALDDHRALMASLDSLALDDAEFYVLNEETGDMPRVSEFNRDRLREEGVRNPDSEWVIALTYGRCDTNAVADELNDRGADAVAVVKPAGGLSLRARGEFTGCTHVAQQFDGGGHGQAAGAHVTDGERGIELASMVDYGDHWSTNGREARRAVRRAFRDALVDN